MKNLIIAVIIILVGITGFFIYKNMSKNNIAIDVSGSPTPSESSKPEISPTPTPTSSPALPDVVKATIVTARGNIELELYTKVAPVTVENFVKLASDKFYDGTKFHRVVPDFVIQGGDPLSKTDSPQVGTGGPGYSFADEINPKSLGMSDADIAALVAQGYKYDNSLQSMPVRVGVIAMANSGPNTNGSQFFIVTTKDQPFLNGKHTVFGKVVKGMDVVLKIKQGDVVSKITIK